MNREAMSPAEARAALDSERAARAHIAALGTCPPWRYVAFGAVIALLILGAGFPIVIQSACMAVSMAGVALIAAYDRGRYGVFINGYRKGATRPVVVVLVLGMMALIFVQVRLREQGAQAWVPFAVAAAAFAFAVAGSVWWGRVFRRELERAA